MPVVIVFQHHEDNGVHVVGPFDKIEEAEAWLALESGRDDEDSCWIVAMSTPEEAY